jgi:hypothetical protein
MRISSIYYGTKPVIAIYAGTKLIYTRGKVSLRDVSAFVTNDIDAVLHLAEALGLEVEMDTSDLGLDAAAEPVTNPSSVMTVSDDSEVKMDAYAELYVKDTLPFNIVEEREVLIESDMSVPSSVAMTQETNLEVEIVVDGVVSDSIPIEQTGDSEAEAAVEVEVEMNTPGSAPMAIDDEIDTNIEVNGEITATPAMGMTVDMTAGSEVFLEAELTVLVRPAQSGTNLYLPAIYSATQNGTNLEVM